MNPTPCPGCGVQLPATDGPVHRYMESSPACWAKYGDLLAREYGNPEYMAAHRLTVDTYAVQHPGTPSPQAVQSVAVHLVSLHCVLERGMTQREATAFLKVCADKGRFEWLTPPTSTHDLTVLHPLAATSAAAHEAAVGEWALAAWESWKPHHRQIRAWAAQLGA